MIRKFFIKARDLFLHLFFPRTCFCCGRDIPKSNPALLCRECSLKLERCDGLICRRCGLPLKNGGAYCFNCRGGKASKYKCSFIRSSLVFNEPSRSLIHSFKYEKYTDIAKFFAALMYKTYKENPPYFEAEFMTPVPIHSRRMRKRGFNQAFLLVKELSKLNGVEVKDILIRTRKTKSQTSLGRAERKENIKEAFSLKKGADVKGKAFILIDDVCTTGATLEECARVLKKYGAREVLALTALRE